MLETKRASGVQTFAVDGYASIERRGNLDSLVLSEFAYDDELFERKVIDDELYYYGHEKQREEERRLQYILVDCSPSMRGVRQVFARGLALTLAKKLALEGDEVWLRFFDSRLYDTQKVSPGELAAPYLLCFKSERGRNYAKVFRQLALELQRLRREDRRQLVVYIITHGQCHIPVEVVQQLRREAYLYGIFILPSSDVSLEYLDLLHRHQIVDDETLQSRNRRRDKALEIVNDAGGRPATKPEKRERRRRRQMIWLLLLGLFSYDEVVRTDLVSHAKIRWSRMDVGQRIVVEIDGGTAKRTNPNWSPEPQELAYDLSRSASSSASSSGPSCRRRARSPSEAENDRTLEILVEDKKGYHSAGFWSMSVKAWQKGRFGSIFDALEPLMNAKAELFEHARPTRSRAGSCRDEWLVAVRRLRGGRRRIVPVQGIRWSFPNDDDTAIEVDEPDLSESNWDQQRWKFAVAMLKCDTKKSKLLAQHKDGTPVREIRVEALEPDGKVRSTSRCVMPLKDWRTRIGKDLVYGSTTSSTRTPLPHAAARAGHAGQVAADAPRATTAASKTMIEANAQLLARAQALFAAGRAAEAERLYRQLLQHTHVIDFEYDEWLKGIAECYRALGRAREAGYVYLYLHAFDRAAEMFPSATAPVDAARVKELEARRVGGEPAQQALRRGGAAATPRPAATCSPRSPTRRPTSAREERKAWERVLRDPRLRGRMYEEALVHFNLGIAATRDGDKDGRQPPPGRRRSACSRRSPTSSRPAASASAPSTATASCSSSARTPASFENLAEGYINCIRVLKEDNLKFYVLQYYEDFLRIALEREEFHAAATVFREAADYARRVGLIYDRGYMKRAAETWWKAAEKNERDGGPVEITENAYLAAIDAYNSVGDFFHVRESYKQLAKLGLGEKKQKRYADVVARYAEVVAGGDRRRALPRLPAAAARLSRDLVPRPRRVGARRRSPRGLRQHHRRRALRRHHPPARAQRAAHAPRRAARKDGAELDPHTLAQIAQDMGELQAYAALRRSSGCRRTRTPRCGAA